MHDQPGVVAEGAKGFGQQAQIAVPEKLIGEDSKVGVD